MKTVTQKHRQKGSALISILILFALVFSTAFYISKDILTFKKEQVRYELLSSRDLLVEQMKQYMYNPVVIGISAVLQSKESTNLNDQIFRRCLDSTYDSEAVVTERCASQICSENSTTCPAGVPHRRPFKGYAPIGRSGDLSVDKICKANNFDSCDYMQVTGVSETNSTRYRSDGTACLAASPGSECIFWVYAEYICDNSRNNPGNPNLACSAVNKNIFINVTMVHATAYPRPTDVPGTTKAATVSSESIIDKNRLNTQDISLTYIPVSEIKDTFTYLCPNNPAPACANVAEASSGKIGSGQFIGCPCNTSKSYSCPGGLVCGTAAAADPNNKCCPCTCPAGLICGTAQAAAAHGCPCSFPPVVSPPTPSVLVCGTAFATALPNAPCLRQNSSSCVAGLVCGTAAAIASPGCPCVDPTCDATLFCTDSNYKPGCPCRQPPATACPATPVDCNDPSHIKGCACNNVGACTGPHECHSVQALAEPNCACTCPAGLITGSPIALLYPGCPTTTASTCGAPAECGTAAANASPGCPCTAPACNPLMNCSGGPAPIAPGGCDCIQVGTACPPATTECGTATALANPGCPCTCHAQATLTCSTNPTSQASRSPGCPSSCPTGLTCGTSAANALKGCACQCPGVTPTCGLNSSTGVYDVSPVPDCPCVPPSPPPPPPPSGS